MAVSKIKLRVDVPEDVCLKWLSGKPVHSNFGDDQRMFVTTDGRFLYVSQVDAEVIEERLRELRIRTGERCLIVKERMYGEDGRTVVQRVNVYPAKGTPASGERPDGQAMVERACEFAARERKAAAAKEAAAAPAAAGPDVLTRTKALIDGYAEAWKYAQTKYGELVGREEVWALYQQAMTAGQ